MNVFHRHTKKRDLLSCSAFHQQMSNICANKKSGTACCCSALRGSGIALYSEQATPKSTPICTHTRTCYKGTSEMMYTSREHQMPQCLGIKIEFTRFRKAKNKALRTPFRHKGKVARFDAYILKCRKPYWGLGSNELAFREGTLPTL